MAMEQLYQSHRLELLLSVVIIAIAAGALATARANELEALLVVLFVGITVLLLSKLSDS